MTFNEHSWVRSPAPTPHPFLSLQGRVALSRKGRGHNVDRRAYCLCVTVVGM
jgi:hypothetical protein